MSDALSFVEIAGQHVELLPARTILSLLSTGGFACEGGGEGAGGHGYGGYGDESAGGFPGLGGVGGAGGAGGAGIGGLGGNI
jgi:hypothetical protein